MCSFNTQSLRCVFWYSSSCNTLHPSGSDHDASRLGAGPIWSSSSSAPLLLSPSHKDHMLLPRCTRVGHPSLAWAARAPVGSGDRRRFAVTAPAARESPSASDRTIGSIRAIPHLLTLATYLRTRTRRGSLLVSHRSISLYPPPRTGKTLLLYRTMASTSTTGLRERRTAEKTPADHEHDHVHAHEHGGDHSHSHSHSIFGGHTHGHDEHDQTADQVVQALKGEGVSVLLRTLLQVLIQYVQAMPAVE